MSVSASANCWLWIACCRRVGPTEYRSELPVTFLNRTATLPANTRTTVPRLRLTVTWPSPKNSLLASTAM